MDDEDDDVDPGEEGLDEEDDDGDEEDDDGDEEDDDVDGESDEAPLMKVHKSPKSKGEHPFLHPNLKNHGYEKSRFLKHLDFFIPLIFIVVVPDDPIAPYQQLK